MYHLDLNFRPPGGHNTAPLSQFSQPHNYYYNPQPQETHQYHSAAPIEQPIFYYDYRHQDHQRSTNHQKRLNRNKSKSFDLNVYMCM